MTKRDIKLYRINGFVGAYEHGKCLGSVYGLTDTMILDVLNIDTKTVNLTYKEYNLPEEYDQSFPENESDFNLIERFRVL